MGLVSVAGVADGPGRWMQWEPVSEGEWTRLREHGRRWLYYGPGDLVVRVLRRYPSCVRVRFEDGHQETVHPDDLHISKAVGS